MQDYSLWLDENFVYLENLFKIFKNYCYKSINKSKWNNPEIFQNFCYVVYLQSQIDIEKKMN